MIDFKNQNELIKNLLFAALLILCQSFIVSVAAVSDEYINFSDMGNYDHSVQKNIDKKMSDIGMVPRIPRGVQPGASDMGCDSAEISNCVRAMEYLQRIVKSLLRQMNVHSHVFGPGEAITIDLQAELKYDDYVILTKFMNSAYESDKYLYRIDEIMSNFIHVVDHSSSRFDFFESVIRFPAFYSLKFWMILLTSMVIGSLIVMLFVKAFNTRSVHIQLFYGFLIIFILSCVWTFSSMYENKKAKMMAHMVQSNSLPPKDCDYQNWNTVYGMFYWFRIHVMRSRDECGEYYENTMADPLWKVNPMEAISQSAAYFFFSPLKYVGGELGGFFLSFLEEAPLLMKPIMLVILLVLIFFFLYGPFRVSTPLLKIEPAWRRDVPALERSNMHAIGHERLRNEIIGRPDGPVVKSIRNAGTDMDGFREYLADKGRDEVEIIGPFPRFNSEQSKDSISITKVGESSTPTATAVTNTSTPTTSAKAFEDSENSCRATSSDEIRFANKAIITDRHPQYGRLSGTLYPDLADHSSLLQGEAKAALHCISTQINAIKKDLSVDQLKKTDGKVKSSCKRKSIKKQ